MDSIRSFESGLSLSNEKGSLNGSYEDSFHSFNTKIGILQRFTELESMHPNALERKVSYKRRKKFTSNDTIKEIEISPDSGQGDDVSLYAIERDSVMMIEECDSAGERRPSKQDAELTEDPDSLYFRDGRRQIDMILCYEEEYDGAMTEEQAIHKEKRRYFQQSLVREGLDLEIEDKR